MKKKRENKTFDYNSSFSIYLRIIKEAFVPNTFWFSVSMIFMLLNSASIGYRAYLIKPAVDKVFIEKNVRSLLYIPLQLSVIAFVISITSFLDSYIMNKTNQNISMKYYKKLFEKIINFDIDFFQNKNSHKILTLFSDINSLMVALGLFMTGLIKQLFSIITLVGVMFYQNFRLSLFAFFAFPIIIFPVYSIGKKLKELAKKGRDISSEFNGTIGESLELLELIKTNSAEKHEMFKFTVAQNTSYKLSMKMIRKSLLTSPMMELAGSIGFALVIWVGGKDVIAGRMTAGSFFTFIASLLSAYKPAKSFAGINIQLQTALACAKRLFIVLDREPKIKDKKNSYSISNVKGDIELNNISFNYPIHNKYEPLVVENENFELSDKKALNNINLKIKHGSSVALVGHSGSGKSTIFKLLLRFYEPLKGTVKIDNNDISNITLKSLRNNIATVNQNVLLFDDTVINNVKYGRFNATNEEVINACKLANADEFIRELEDGYNTKLGPNGCVLSGGQKQRISIARAILKDAPILLLDEATSALDPISEKLIQKALNKLMKNRTTIIIAHRLTTVQNCDKIFVFQEGNLMEEGNHFELMDKNGLYANLYKKQFEKAI